MAVADDLEGLHHRDAGRHHGRELTGKYGDVLRLRLPTAPHPALGFDASGCDALTSQVRTQCLFVRGKRLAANLMAALVLTFPDELDVFLSCRCGYRHKSDPRSHYLFDGDAVYFFQTCCAHLHLFQTGAAQIPHAVFDRLIVNVHVATAFHSDAADGVR